MMAFARAGHGSPSSTLSKERVRVLTESFDYKLADVGNPLVRQLGRHLCRPRADWSQPRVTEVDWCSAGQQLLGYTDWGFPCFSSVVRQMPGYNLKGARPAFPNHGGLQLKWFPPQVAEAISQSVPNTSGFNCQRAIQPKSFSQRTSCLMGLSPTSSDNL
jgi:hypothetical protein